ncbi:MAG: undecaprenyl-diphosphate phosphatase [Deltaproteobacteria bacterium]|nr:undecaprenyl-diphosphate phosphatase [Deltaproteobacteria bacterium]
MTILDAVILGVVQGITEFLPISSSGHLVVGQHALGLKSEGGGVLFEVVVHAGSLLAVLAVYANDLWRILLASLRALPAFFQGRFAESIADPEARLGAFIVLGTIPTGLMGVALKDLFESLFGSLSAVGAAFLLTGLLLWISGRISARQQGEARGPESLRVRDALIVGVAQGIAITPGISRSGTTIATAMILGIDRSLAARFSFLLSIPAILGALVLHLKDGVGALEAGAGVFLAGFLAAAISGYLALRLLLVLVDRGRFGVFAYYLWPLGLAVLGWALAGG